MQLHETIVQASGVELCVESFGDPADPAILLVMGVSASMVWWEEEFCRRLDCLRGSGTSSSGRSCANTT